MEKGKSRIRTPLPRFRTAVDTYRPSGTHACARKLGLAAGKRCSGGTSAIVILPCSGLLLNHHICSVTGSEPSSNPPVQITIIPRCVQRQPRGHFGARTRSMKRGLMAKGAQTLFLDSIFPAAQIGHDFRAMIRETYRQRNYQKRQSRG